jgi:hypothetical protein
VPRLVGFMTERFPPFKKISPEYPLLSPENVKFPGPLRVSVSVPLKAPDRVLKVPEFAIIVPFVGNAKALGRVPVEVNSRMPPHLERCPQNRS